jgi:D-psicose/D-tagatose/L-ribulose 3-epimerase
LVWAGDLSPESTRKVITQTKAAGFDLIELSLHGPKVMDLSLTRDLLQEHNLEIGCSRGLTFDADISSEDPAVVSRGMALLEEGVRITAELGGAYFGGILYSAMGKYAAPITAKGRQNAVESLKRIAELAQKKNVTEICSDLVYGGVEAGD